jgi:hypothetical protein
VGVDFLKAKCGKFSKGWDAQRLRAALSPLNSVGSALNDVVARTNGPHELEAGQEVMLHAEGDRVSIVVDLVPTGTVETTPAVAAAIRESGAYARGIIQTSHPAQGLLSIQIQ